MESLHKDHFNKYDKKPSQPAILYTGSSCVCHSPPYTYTSSLNLFTYRYSSGVVIMRGFHCDSNVVFTIVTS